MHVFLILSFFFHELEYTINMPSPMSLSCFCLNEINIWFFAAFVLGFHDILLSWPADPSTALESSTFLRISVSDSWRLHEIKGRLYWFHEFSWNQFMRSYIHGSHVFSLVKVRCECVICRSQTVLHLWSGLPSALRCNLILVLEPCQRHPRIACCVCTFKFLNRDSETIAIV